MPLTTTDIAVPFVTKPRKDGSGADCYCQLCEEVIGTDYHFQPEPHLLTECLIRMKGRIAKLEAGEELR